MRWIDGDLVQVALKERANVLGFTANSVVTKSRRLVMGVGAAKAVRNHFLGIDELLGKKILGNGQPGIQPDYYLAGVDIEYGDFRGKIVAVQVKRSYSDFDTLTSGKCFDLAKTSLGLLANRMKFSPSGLAVINCPLIGKCGYDSRPQVVFNMVEEVFVNVDNVIVCVLGRRKV